MQYLHYQYVVVTAAVATACIVSDVDDTIALEEQIVDDHHFGMKLLWFIYE